MYRLIFCLSLLLLFGCGDDIPNTTATFEVTIENLSSGEIATPLSPGIYLTKKDGFPLFFTGSQDYGQGLSSIAGDGQVEPLLSNLQQHPDIITVGSFPLIRPGQSTTFQVDASYGDFLNFATMFMQSNDLFYAFDDDGHHLFEPDGEPRSGDVTGFVWLWDTGTEVNQEPYVGSFQTPRQSFPGEGEQENGFVTLVNDTFQYPEVTEVIRVSFRPIN